MKYNVLITIIVLLLGLSTDSLAFGQKRHLASAQEIQHSEQQGSVLASIAADGKHNKIDSTASQRDANPQAAVIDKKSDVTVKTKIGLITEPEHHKILVTRWTNQEGIMPQLNKRISDLEIQLVAPGSERAVEEIKLLEEKIKALLVATAEDRSIALMTTGVRQPTAKEIVSHQSEMEFAPLELQDQAVPENFAVTAVSTEQTTHPEGLQPSPSLDPLAVVSIQVEALRANGPNNDGIQLTYLFASPDNKRSTGPLDRFIRMVHSNPYDRLLNHRSARYSPVLLSGKEALQMVTVVDEIGEEATFLWVLSLQSEGKYNGCWMTDAVISKQQLVPRRVA